ncbi:MAG: 3-phosphoshikimate 1-carboxyvinyltransferase [Cuneatibacter sp.]|nr:3-phosphoshikimate 1-carboxyvinyltransferase [Cuneatibacter sp.]
MKFTSVSGLRGTVTVPGDKSISHRAVLFGSIAKGITRVEGFLQGADCLSTISCFRRLGIDIENEAGIVTVHGKGLHGLQAPTEVLDCGNSGTTTRLISGILSGQKFPVTLTGDASIQKRPMGRIIKPLTQMGAQITSERGDGCAPLHIQGGALHGIHYQPPVASAQVKSAILLAGLYAEGETAVTEPTLSRNHTELMLKGFGADISSSGTTASIRPVSELHGQGITVPGDISSAAYFLAAGSLIPNSEILIQNVGINPTRAGIITVCNAMGADLTLLNEHVVSGEPVADLLIRTSQLKATTIEGAIIPTLIDELPVIALMACFAEGTTIIRDAAELKVKESDRIQVMVDNLTAMGAHVEGTDDGMIIEGGHPLHGAVVDSHLDHRIAMTFAIAGKLASGETEITGAECVNISYPTYYQDMEMLQN